MSDPGEGESLPLTNQNETFNPAVEDINTVTKNLVTTDPHHARAPSTVSSGIFMQSDHSTGGGRPVFTEDFPHGESASSDGPGGVLCAVCPKRACKSCLTCVASYCELHVMHHYTAPALRRHKLVEATGDLQQRLCPQHHRELEFYCRTDQTPVCALCAIKQHSGHDIVEQEQKPQMKECELTAQKNIPAPENVSLKADQTSVSVSWSKPAGVDEVSYQLTLSSDGECLQTITTKSLQCSFTGLDKEREYSISAVTVLKNGGQSKPIYKAITTELDL